MKAQTSQAYPKLTPLALKDAPALIEAVFPALRSLYERLDDIDADEVEAVFGPLVDGIRTQLTVMAGGRPK